MPQPRPNSKSLCTNVDGNCLKGVHMASMTADSLSVNKGGHCSVVAQLTYVLKPLKEAAIHKQPCYCHGLYNTLLTRVSPLAVGTRASVKDIDSHLAQSFTCTVGPCQTTVARVDLQYALLNLLPHILHR